ncbi:uncharacterized protein [Spinacia oleracea]|uniref:Protein WAVE n=1 Tax=Spinacia oleracea TaxID=3562 RepID=A0A9R0JF81_SPIOL|nr:uncharacterized protein LOC110804156 [Spinacia oleracea]
MVLASAGSKIEIPNENPPSFQEIEVQNPSNVPKNKQVSVVDLIISGKSEHNSVEEGREFEVCKSKLDTDEASKNLQNDSLAEAANQSTYIKPFNNSADAGLIVSIDEDREEDEHWFTRNSDYHRQPDRSYNMMIPGHHTVSICTNLVQFISYFFIYYPHHQRNPRESRDTDGLTSFAEEGLGPCIQSQPSHECGYLGHPSLSGGNSKEDDASEKVSQLQKSPALSLIDDGGQSSCCAKLLFDADESPNTLLAKEVPEATQANKCAVVEMETMSGSGGDKMPSQIHMNYEVTDAASHDLDGRIKHNIKKAPAYLASSGNGSLDNPVIIDDEKENFKFDPFEVFGTELDCRIKKLECVVFTFQDANN